MSINNPLNPLKKVSGTSPDEVYSTEETRIGTWIDGRPVYRRVSTAKTSTTSNTWVKVMDVPNIGQMVFAMGLAYENSGGDVQVMFPNNVCNIGRKDDGIYAIIVDNQDLLNRGVHWVVEYTKTTDQPEATT